MRKTDFNTTITINNSSKKAYRALTENIKDWWTSDFEGKSDAENEVFTVRFEKTFKVMEVIQLVKDENVVWRCEDSLIDMEELHNKSEWTGTIIEWNIKVNDKKTVISITHKGLRPQIECYDVCEKGWHSFLNSLRLYLETGKGQPFGN